MSDTHSLNSKTQAQKNICEEGQETLRCIELVESGDGVLYAHCLIDFEDPMYAGHLQSKYGLFKIYSEPGTDDEETLRIDQESVEELILLCRERVELEVQFDSLAVPPPHGTNEKTLTVAYNKHREDRKTNPTEIVFTAFDVTGKQSLTFTESDVEGLKSGNILQV